MQLRTMASYLKLIAAVVAAGAILATGVSFTVPKEYVSSATIQGTTVLDRPNSPEAADRVVRIWQDLVSRRSLSELIQRPDLDLYRSERETKPLEDVMEDVKTKDLRLEILRTPGLLTFRVSFTYPDRHKAQSVVSAITKKIMSADPTRRVVTLASLPEAPVKPDRPTFMFWGLGVGLFTGILTSLLLWRAKWTMKLVAFGLAGCAIAAALSMLFPSRYASRGILRVTTAPKADSARQFLSEAAMSDWLRKNEGDVLSDASLADIHPQRLRQATCGALSRQAASEHISPERP